MSLPEFMCSKKTGLAEAIWNTAHSSTRPRALDIFAGAGGLSLGSALAGLDITHAIERDVHAAASHAHNFPRTALLRQDVLTTEPAAIGPSAFDVLLAGPPCQPFSTSNQRTRQDGNPQIRLLFEPVRFIEAFRPRLAVVENVGGLAIGSRKVFLERLTAQLSSIGYYVQIVQGNALAAGIPQKRTRLFIVATSIYIKQLLLHSSPEPLTVRDAISDLPDLQNGSASDQLPYKQPSQSSYSSLLRGNLSACGGHLVTSNNSNIIERYRHIPPGGNWKSVPRNQMASYKNVLGCHTGIYHRLSWDQPSKIIANYRKNMLIHPDQSRGLSVREAARLQSFPDHFDFSGSIGKQQQQVGNAVPPLLAKQVLDACLQATGLT